MSRWRAGAGRRWLGPLLAAALLATALLATALLAAACPGLPHRDLGRGRDAAPAASGPTVVLISLDGFRHDYLERYAPPTLQALAREGARAQALVPVFPTKTFPSHYSMVTGLYPEHHGIVENEMYDSVFDATFSLGDRAAVSDGRWWQGMPIWVWAERHGVRTAAMFWPGTEAEIGGQRPRYWHAYDGAFRNRDRIDQVLAWLDLPVGERPRFITLYLSNVDSAGHEHGPDSPAVARAVAQVDRHLGQLRRGIAERRLAGAVDLIVVSDHGMAATSPDRVIVLADAIDLDSVRIDSLSCLATIEPKPGREPAVYEGLRTLPHLRVYRRAEIPERLHYRNHRRIPGLIAIADEGWLIAKSKPGLAARKRPLPLGMHGYDNNLRSMHGIFVAAGPSFRRGVTVPAFENIHLFPLLLRLLGLPPHPSDADPAVLAPLLAAH